MDGKLHPPSKRGYSTAGQFSPHERSVLTRRITEFTNSHKFLPGDLRPAEASSLHCLPCFHFKVWSSNQYERLSCCTGPSPISAVIQYDLKSASNVLRLFFPLMHRASLHYSTSTGQR
jgi:hypothetical protein